MFTTQLYQYLSMIFLFALVSDEPEVFLPKYSQTAILHAAYLRWVVNQVNPKVESMDYTENSWKYEIIQVFTT